ncbi:unnamed protein product [Strongylus vulgaris]|uniref:VM domain-containing protein n=1 Tax=Strongylus vulgaris TaxID=40348 RepID=A0A3P7KV89_STRVU|nr:unnamed protein product [Strongylus vulgaris]
MHSSLVCGILLLIVSQAQSLVREKRCPCAPSLPTPCSCGVGPMPSHGPVSHVLPEDLPTCLLEKLDPPVMSFVLRQPLLTFLSSKDNDGTYESSHYFGGSTIPMSYGMPEVLPKDVLYTKCMMAAPIPHEEMIPEPVFPSPLPPPPFFGEMLPLPHGPGCMGPGCMTEDALSPMIDP